MSKKTSNDIGNGLLHQDKSKYKTKHITQDYQMEPISSSRYNYASLDDEPKSKPQVYVQPRPNPVQPSQNQQPTASYTGQPQRQSQSGMNTNPQTYPSRAASTAQPKGFNPPIYQSNFNQYPVNPYTLASSSYYSVSNYQYPPAMQVPPQTSYYQPYQQYKQPPQNSTITLNGMRFPMQSVMEPSSRSSTFTSSNSNNNLNTSVMSNSNNMSKVKVPDMLVTCNYCQSAQNVAGNIKMYVCYQCRQKNQCFPVYNLVKCVGCQAQVCYQFGVSRLIKCTKCKQVNQVPVSLEEVQTKSKLQSKPAQQIEVKEEKQREEVSELIKDDHTYPLEDSVADQVYLLQEHEQQNKTQ